jgi:hypothetical protein
VRWALVLVAASVGACGFRNIPNEGADLAGHDLAGADLSGGGGGGGGGVGPGPVGALPTGYCCTRREECRSRRCISVGGGPSFCSDDCDTDLVCTAWGGAFRCDVDAGWTCQPTTASYTCLDPSTYHYGAKRFGACCASGFSRAGEECQGGLCNSVGPVSNPFYCTQGCIPGIEPCPIGYSCGSARFCIPNDPNATYACTP